MPRSIYLAVLIVAASVAFVAEAQLPERIAPDPKVRSIVLFIGDGMGFEQVRSAHLYQGRPMAFETLAHLARVTTRSADNHVTDSAASATAIATGQKVNNRVLSLDITVDRPLAEGEEPGELKTILETLAEQGKAVGLVTTDELTQATPAAFGSHVPDRNDIGPIADWYIDRTKPNVLFGGGKRRANLTADRLRENGYRVAESVGELFAIVQRGSAGEQAVEGPMHLAGLFGDGTMPYSYLDGTLPVGYYERYPTLAEMTRAALIALDRDPDGFFLMVECAGIDKTGHNINVEDDRQRTLANIGETIALSNAVQTTLDFLADRDDVLILVTADHETGGLSVESGNGTRQLPTVRWSHNNHTAADVGLWAEGPGSQHVTGLIDDTDIYRLMFELTR